MTVVKTNVRISGRAMRLTLTLIRAHEEVTLYSILLHRFLTTAPYVDDDYLDCVLGTSVLRRRAGGGCSLCIDAHLRK